MEKNEAVKKLYNCYISLHAMNGENKITPLFQVSMEIAITALPLALLKDINPSISATYRNKCSVWCSNLFSNKHQLSF